MRGAGEGKRFVVGSWQLLIIRGRGRGGRQTDGTQAPATNYQLPTTAVTQHACRAAAFHQRRLLCWRRGLLRWEHAPLAQLDRASGYEPEGREFESLRARHLPFQILRCAQDSPVGSHSSPAVTRSRPQTGSSSNLSERASCPFRSFAALRISAGGSRYAHAAKTAQVQISPSRPIIPPSAFGSRPSALPYSIGRLTFRQGNCSGARELLRA